MVSPFLTRRCFEFLGDVSFFTLLKEQFDFLTIYQKNQDKNLVKIRFFINSL